VTEGLAHERADGSLQGQGESVAEVEAAITGDQKVFSAIERARPRGRPLRVEQARRRRHLRGAAGARGRVDNPLTALPAFVEFQEDLKKWVSEPPTLEQMTVIGSYRLF
jgi:hypothetical protein